MSKEKVLYFTNTPAEYRIPLYKEMCRTYPVKFVFTAFDLANKIYDTNVTKDKIQSIRYSCIEKEKAKEQIAQLIRDDSIRVVVVPTLDSIYETKVALIVYYFAKKYGKKIVYFWEKWDAPKNKQPIKRRIRNMVQKKLLLYINRKCECFIAGGSKTKEYYLNQGIDAEKCRTIYNVSMVPKCECSNWKDEAGVPKDRIVLLYFGRLIERKGIRFLIDALTEIDSRLNNRIWLVIAGDGEVFEKYKEYASDRGVNNVTWLGYISPDRRYDFFTQSDVFVLPSYYYEGIPEPWGLTINEAIECGKACITTKAVGSAYDLINENNGIVVEPGSSRALALAIKTALEKDIVSSASIEDREILKKYNYTSSAESFCRIFEGLV